MIWNKLNLRITVFYFSVICRFFCIYFYFDDHTFVMNMYKKSNRLLQAIQLPLTVGAAVYLICEAARILGSVWQGAQSELLVFADEFEHIVPCFFAFFIPYKLCGKKSTRKALWSLLCFFSYSSAYNAVSAQRATVFAGILAGLLFAYIFNALHGAYPWVAAAFLGIVLGVACGYLYDVYENVLIYVLNIIGSRGSVTAFLFGFLNNIFELISPDFKLLVYEKSYGGALFLDGSVVTGAKNIYAASSGATAVSTFLSGRFIQLFAVPGIAMAIAEVLKDGKKRGFIVLAVCCVLSGNTSILYLYILLESPFLFLSGAFIAGVSYLAASLLDFSAGFAYSGGAAELIMNFGGNFLLLVVGIVITVLSYFVFRYSIIKYDVSESENLYIPQRLKNVVEALGGVHNIIRLVDNGIEVRNIKKVNTLKLSGEMKENIFVTDDPEVVALGEYL